MFSSRTRQLTEKFLEARDRAEIATDPNGPEMAELRKLAQELIVAEKQARKDHVRDERKSIVDSFAQELKEAKAHLRTEHKEKYAKAKSDAGRKQADTWLERNIEKTTNKLTKQRQRELDRFDKKVAEYV